MKQLKNGVNWSKNILKYFKALNNDTREEVGQQSPFEVCYGKKSQELVSCGKGVTSSIIQALERVNWDFKSLSEI